LSVLARCLGVPLLLARPPAIGFLVGMTLEGRAIDTAFLRIAWRKRPLGETPLGRLAAGLIVANGLVLYRCRGALPFLCHDHL